MPITQNLFSLFFFFFFPQDIPLLFSTLEAELGWSDSVASLHSGALSTPQDLHSSLVFNPETRFLLANPPELLSQALTERNSEVNYSKKEVCAECFILGEVTVVFFF